MKFCFQPLEKITNIVTSATGSIFKCSFDRQINSTNPKIFDLNTKWYLFIAEGFITGNLFHRFNEYILNTIRMRDNVIC